MENSEQTGQLFMNPHTGSVDDYDGWFYFDENGVQKNGVDRQEVIPVIWKKETETWIETWSGVSLHEGKK